MGRVFLGHAVSPSPAAPLCWAFCLPPREPVGPSELCAQELSRSFQNQCFFCLWSPAGSQAVDGVVFGLQLVADPLLWVHAWGQPATDPVECSPRSFLSVLPGGWALIRAPTHRGFRCGPQAAVGYAPTGALWDWCSGSRHLSGCLPTRCFRCGPLDA